ncbi:MAG: hypothetical protein U9O56_03225 [Campylobacterota bacterium]|nr:hypothetical protein [Campylobacterota bacterium]
MRNKIFLIFLTSLPLLSNDNFQYKVDLKYLNNTLEAKEQVSGDTFSIKEKESITIPTIEIRYKNRDLLYISSFSTIYSHDNIIDSTQTVYSDIENRFTTAGYKRILKDVKFGLNIHNYYYNIHFYDNENSIPIENSYTFPTISVDVDTKLNKNYAINYGATAGYGTNMNYYNLYLEADYEFGFSENSHFSIGYNLSEFYILKDQYNTFHRYQGPYIDLNIIF